MSKILVTGAEGMLGHRVVAEARRLGHEVVACSRADLDVTRPESADAAIAAAMASVVINCAAWTDVDAAEGDLDAAMAVNAHGAGNVARAAAAHTARLVHVSTDYVFDGTATRPWIESDPVGPLGAYGLTKLRGEEQVAEAIEDHAIVRTAWLFGPGGGNFIDTMLRHGRARDEVSVVTDQRGSPTFTGHLAPALVELAERSDRGIFHLAGAGDASWYELCLEAFDVAGVECRVLPTTSEQFPRPAPRPAWSVLGTEREDPVLLPRWQDGVAAHLAAVGVAA